MSIEYDGVLANSTGDLRYSGTLRYYFEHSSRRCCQIFNNFRIFLDSLSFIFPNGDNKVEKRNQRGEGLMARGKRSSGIELDLGTIIVILLLLFLLYLFAKSQGWIH